LRPNFVHTYHRPRQKERTTRTAGSLMDGCLSYMGFNPTNYAVFDIWDREIHGMIKGCKAVAIQGSKIFVEVPSVVHRQELMYQKDHLIERINQVFGKKVITEIRFELHQKEGGRTL
jgi:hypothetical protein